MTVTERPSVPGYWYPAPTDSAQVTATDQDPAEPVSPASASLSSESLSAESASSESAAPVAEAPVHTTPVLEPTERERAVAVLHAVRRFRRSDAVMRSRTATVLSVNPTDLAALRRLVAADRLGEQVSPTELAVYLEISSAATTKLLNRLGELGHIRRQPHPTDRRAQLIVATDEADTAIRQALGHSHDRMLEVVTSLSPDEQQTVIRFLDALGEAVSEAGTPT